MPIRSTLVRVTWVWQSNSPGSRLAAADVDGLVAVQPGPDLADPAAPR
jgi:hypothetical protein